MGRVSGYFHAARFAATHPRSGKVMTRKLIKRLMDPAGRHSERDNLAWLAAHAEDPAVLAQEIAPDVWAEAVGFGERLRARAETILPSVPFQFGGGAAHEFLYWLTRLRRPEVIVETGVAAGWTSQAFLAALEANAHGRLYSSDFPLFRFPGARNYIGCLVDPTLKDRWTLLLEGDEINLPRILADTPRVDLFHYDSDKSYSGRQYAVGLVREKLTPDGVIVMDDIDDNSWFYDEAERGDAPFTILERGRRFGVLGDLQSTV